MIIQESQKVPVVTKSNDDVVYLVEEWKTVWQSKVLSYGDREAKSLSTIKLSGINFITNTYIYVLSYCYYTS